VPAHKAAEAHFLLKQAQKCVNELIRDVRFSLDSDRIAAASTSRKSAISGVQKNRIGRSAKMADLLKTVNRCGNAFQSRLQLEGETANSGATGAD
jgi:hypothetical protein